MLVIFGKLVLACHFWKISPSVAKFQQCYMFIEIKALFFSPFCRQITVLHGAPFDIE